jgi:hypothetical protein
MVKKDENHAKLTPGTLSVNNFFFKAWPNLKLGLLNTKGQTTCTRNICLKKSIIEKKSNITF